MPVHSLQGVALFQHDVEEVFSVLGLEAMVPVDEDWLHDVLVESLEVLAASDLVGLRLPLLSRVCSDEWLDEGVLLVLLASYIRIRLFTHTLEEVGMEEFTAICGHRGYGAVHFINLYLNIDII